MNIIRINNEIFSLKNILKIKLINVNTDDWKILFYYNNNASTETTFLAEDLAKETLNKIEKILQKPLDN